MCGFLEKEKMKESTETNLQEIKNLFISVKATKERMLEKLLDKRVNHILNLSENWDDNGAEKFKKETLERVSNLLKKILQELWDQMVDVPFPLISPVPDGSVDINWETDKFELLINVPAKDNLLVNLYGERMSHPEDEVEVRINYDMATQYVIPWLIKVSS